MSDKPDDLEERTYLFAKRVREFIKKLPRSIANHQDGIQLVKASGSVGANYIEAKEGVSNKDYFYRIKVCKKEARESNFWLKLFDTKGDEALESERNSLIAESIELSKIFWSIGEKEKNNTR
jgi:four helix bundle protein